MSVTQCSVFSHYLIKRLWLSHADPNQKKISSTAVSSTTAPKGVFSFGGSKDSTEKAGFTFGAGSTFVAGSAGVYH